MSVTLTADDYAAATRLHLLNHYRRAGPFSIILAALALYGLFLYANFARGWLTALPAAIFGWPVELPAMVFHLAALWLLGLPLLNYFLLAPRTARRHFRQQKSLHQPLTYTWSQAGLRLTAENGDWLFPWDHYLARAENPELLLFYQGPLMFNILPKRVLTPEQMADLRACADPAGG